MTKKSNKTSHVLNLLTNRAVIETEAPIPVCPAKGPEPSELDVADKIRKNLEKLEAMEASANKQEEKNLTMKKEQDDMTMEGFVLANVLEEVIRLEAPKIITGYGMCCCERCVNDVLAITLNRMPSMYVVSKKGSLFAKVASCGLQYRTDIYTKITEACAIVSKSPNHL